MTWPNYLACHSSSLFDCFAPQGFSVQGQYGAVAPAEVSDPQPETLLPKLPPLTSDPVLWPRSPSSSSSQATQFPLPQPVWCQVSSSC